MPVQRTCLAVHRTPYPSLKPYSFPAAQLAHTQQARSLYSSAPSDSVLPPIRQYLPEYFSPRTSNGDGLPAHIRCRGSVARQLLPSPLPHGLRSLNSTTCDDDFSRVAAVLPGLRYVENPGCGESRCSSSDGQRIRTSLTNIKELCTPSAPSSSVTYAQSAEPESFSMSLSSYPLGASRVQHRPVSVQTTCFLGEVGSGAYGHLSAENLKQPSKPPPRRKRTEVMPRRSPAASDSEALVKRCSLGRATEDGLICYPEMSICSSPVIGRLVPDSLANLCDSDSDSPRPQAKDDARRSEKPDLNSLEGKPFDVRWEVGVQKMRSGKYRCVFYHGDDICNYKACKQAVRRHIEAVHLKIKRYECRFCDQRYAQKTSLIIHESGHTGERKFVCEYGCGERFRDPSKRYHHHVRKHSYQPRQRQGKKIGNVSRSRGCH